MENKQIISIWIYALQKGFYHSKFYDKRDHFSFLKVINFPCLKYRNIHNDPAYGIYLSQILRIWQIRQLTKMLKLWDSKDKKGLFYHISKTINIKKLGPSLNCYISFLVTGKI